jgi:hypothetical protein
VDLSTWLQEFKRRRVFRALVGYGLEWPRFARLQRRSDLREMVRRLDAALAVQRTQVVAMLCGPQRRSDTWQPAPGTFPGAAPR